MRKQGTATSPASVGGRGAGRCHPHPADSQENACTAGAKRSRPVSGLTSGARTCLPPSSPSSQSTRRSCMLQTTPWTSDSLSSPLRRVAESGGTGMERLDLFTVAGAAKACAGSAKSICWQSPCSRFIPMAGMRTPVARMPLQARHYSQRSVCRAFGAWGTSCKSSSRPSHSPR